MANPIDQVMKSWLRAAGPFELITGLTPMDVAAARQTGPLTFDPYLTNAPAHALTTEALAQRYGPYAAHALGALQEVPSGIANVRAGGSFFTIEGEEGFSLPDLMANTVGVEAANGALGQDFASTLIRFLSEQGLLGDVAEGLAKSNPLKRYLEGLAPPPK